MTTNTWNKWLEKNWMEIEPEMKRVLRNTFKTPMYAGEFDDIIQEFVTYLLGWSNDTVCEWEASPEKHSSHVYLIAHWCLNRGVTVRSRVERHGEVELDGADEIEDCPDTDSDYDEAMKLLARCDEVLQKHPRSHRFMDVWGMWKEGISFVDMAKQFNVSNATVNSIVRDIKDVLRKELKGNMNCQPIINMMKAA